MNISNLNLNLLKVFESVYRTGSMTHAARELHLTQSGVSQHIRSLEESLGAELFDRLKHRLVPNHLGDTLFLMCSHSLTELEKALKIVCQREEVISGVVRIGMPPEFGNNYLLPRMVQFSKMHPGVTYDFRYGLTDDLKSSLFKGEIDFAFLDGMNHLSSENGMLMTRAYDEVLYLCMTKSAYEKSTEKGLTPENSPRAYFESLRYVDYVAEEAILRKWFEHHYGWKKWGLRIISSGLNPQGLVQMVLSGEFTAVLPDHLMKRIDDEHQAFHRISGPGKPMVNQIYLANIDSRTLSPVAHVAYNWLKSELSKK